MATQGNHDSFCGVEHVVLPGYFFSKSEGSEVLDQGSLQGKTHVQVMKSFYSLFSKQQYMKTNRYKRTELFSISMKAILTTSFGMM